MRLLIVRMSALGDLVTSMAVLQFIKKKYPYSQIDWLVDEQFAELLKPHPHINQVHSISLKKNKKNVLQLICEFLSLKRKKVSYDYIFDMQGLIKSSLAARCLGSSVVGYDRHSIKESLASLLYDEKVSISFDEHILLRNFELFKKPLGLDLTYDEIQKKEPYLFFDPPQIAIDKLLSSEKKNVLVVLGGSWSSKIYPKERLIDVLNKLSDVEVHLLWSNDEEFARASWLKEQNTCFNLLPKMSLNDLKAFIEKVDLVLGNDTGPTHMAWALNRPSLTLLGCTSETRIAVNPLNQVVSSTSVVNPSKINKQDLSIKDIDPEEIAEKALALL